MNYRNDIEKCIEYIEANIQEPFSVKEIADKAGYSVFHFSRVFRRIMGMSIMEYVRKRRLSLAAQELLQAEKIIDVAYNHGFDTASGFSKAFRKEYGYSPLQYIKRMKPFYQQGISDMKGIYTKEPQIVSKPAFKVAGYGIKTNIIGNSYTSDIGAFWENFNGENLEAKLYEILNPIRHGEIGVCMLTSEWADIIYVLGVIVENFSKATDDMMLIEIPEAEYAVFETLPVNTVHDLEQREFAQVIKNTWKYIFEEWFPDSGYCYDEDKYDFEYYDERCHFRPDTVMEIYIPVKKV